MKRIYFIDGFRGIAVLLVFFFHTNILRFGFSGVELFFVISGFVITLSLINEFKNYLDISILKFFKKRISKVYPSLIITICFTLILFIKFPLVSIENKIFSQALYTSLGIENFYEIFNNLGYWEQGVKSPLLHTWSICIELQFYLVWVLLLKYLLKKTKLNIKKSTLILVFLSFLITIYLSTIYNFDILYYNPISRISSFLIGSFVGLISYNKKRIKSIKNNFIILFLISLLILTTFYFKLNDINLFRGLNLIYCSIFGMLIYLLSITEFKWLNIFIENKLLLIIGKISYSFYLIHMPIIVLISPENISKWFNINLFDKTYTLILIQFVISFCIAGLMYYMLEKNFKLYSIKTAVMYLVLFPILVTLIISNSSLFKDITKSSKNIDIKWIESDPVVTDGKNPILVIGDSWSRRIAMGIYYAQEEINENTYSILSYGVGNGSIMQPDYFITGDTNSKLYQTKAFHEYLNYWENAINKYKPKSTIIVFGKADQGREVINGEELQVGNPKFDSLFKTQYQKIINFLKKNNIKKIYITNVPNNAHTSKEFHLNKLSDAMNKNIDEVAKKNNDITLIDIKHFLEDGNENLSPYIIDKTTMYDETNHTSFEGSLLLSNYILKQIKENKS